MRPVHDIVISVVLSLKQGQITSTKPRDTLAVLPKPSKLTWHGWRAGKYRKGLRIENVSFVRLHVSWWWNAGRNCELRHRLEGSYHLGVKIQCCPKFVPWFPSKLASVIGKEWWWTNGWKGFSHHLPIDFPLFSNTKAIAWCLCIHLLEHVLAGGAPSLDASNGPWLIVFEYFCAAR